MKRLDRLTRAVEQGRDPFADVDEAIAHERAISHSLGGRTVFDESNSQQPKRGQLSLFRD
jgi:hypothetical protein